MIFTEFDESWQVQKWDGYQRCSMSIDGYIPRWKEMLLPHWVCIYSVWLMAIDTYPVEKKMYFFWLSLGMYPQLDR